MEFKGPVVSACEETDLARTKENISKIWCVLECIPAWQGYRIRKSIKKQIFLLPVFIFSAARCLYVCLFNIDKIKRKF